MYVCICVCVNMCVCVHCVRRTNLFEVAPNVLRQFIPNSRLQLSHVNGHNYAQGEREDETMQNQAEDGEEGKALQVERRREKTKNKK